MCNELLLTDDEVLTKYSDMVYKLALSRTRTIANAEDVFQEVFLRYVKVKNTFRSNEHIKAWLIRVTINCSKKIWSSAWFRHTVSLEENIQFTSEEKSYVYYAVIKLPLKYRTVIHLYYYEDMSIREISKILNKKESTITSQLCRARKNLKELLKGEYCYD
ncbi:RNA polymerase sigma factor [Clostridium chromiireducens]|uniref:ECF RNA polymerase sigma factor SigW n=1 Tax=Clostridium chromiireducens TaxID=225345 RepID=A0A1V4J1T5_9CLOT|nr:sigma-70 family RNA polymerase sigma factor [Clostridium chromiireducens]OPJ66116.1 ECF RNA polymerase sigma factor SigW [Clostridium chromiireducens]